MEAATARTNPNPSPSPNPNPNPNPNPYPNPNPSQRGGDGTRLVRRVAQQVLVVQPQHERGNDRGHGRRGRTRRRRDGRGGGHRVGVLELVVQVVPSRVEVRPRALRAECAWLGFGLGYG